MAKPVSGVALNPLLRRTHRRVLILMLIHLLGLVGAPWLLMGLGAVGVGVGAVFGATAQSTLDEINDPNATGTQLLVADGKSSALMANVGFGVWLLLASRAYFGIY